MEPSSNPVKYHDRLPTDFIPSLDEIDQRIARSFIHSSQTDEISKCYFCAQQHRLKTCHEFRESNPDERWDWIRTTKVCSCCLESKKHCWRNCPHSQKCNVDGCRNFHHPLLHIPRRHKVQNLPQRIPNENDGQKTNTKMEHQTVKIERQLMATKPDVLYQILPVEVKAAD